MIVRVNVIGADEETGQVKCDLPQKKPNLRPNHINVYSGVGLTEFKGAYPRVSVHRIAPPMS